MQRRKLLISALCLVLTLLSFVGGSLAWLSKEQAAEGIFAGLSDFEVQGVLTFNGKEYAGNRVLVPVSLTPDGALYIGDMRYSVHYTGLSPAYLRVRILEQWVDPLTNDIVSSGYLHYNSTGTAVNLLDRTAPSRKVIGSGRDALAEEGTWIDNRKSDYCYYYSVPIQPKNVAVTENGDKTVAALGDGMIEIGLLDQTVTGVTEKMLAGLDTAAELSLLIEVEAVQPNRIREFWGIDRLPSA